MCVVEKAVYRKREISSTYIREALKVGNVELAEKLLGYRYRTEGVVEHAYGKYVEIEFCAFERPESRFASLEELKTQVDRDILFGMEYFRAQQ